MLEYDPKPPFDITEDNAPAELLAEVRSAARPLLEERLRPSQRAVARVQQGRGPQEAHPAAFPSSTRAS
ncbi:hypothetical protein [Xanthobacter sp. 126]|uniref:hypothetical protein n=1 Tax=Xanthobacter sp. 126 TaxID=1131814 RepID=UPI0004B10732|nr:hypothetical protein [Xanthobacter sp. 126]